MGPLRIEVIDRVYAGILASKTPAERIAIADSAHRTARGFLKNRIAQLHPDASVEDRQREFLKRMLGDGTIGPSSPCR
jgi:hypothetical protein